ncbi:hypothetical protein E8P77_10415 [Soehngenia saccharolytica]|nr:hypothetical protein E8P77_10415 [Soehngenia saccharolytica]
MESIKYLDLLKSRLSRFFDIEENYILDNTNFELMAKCEVVSERYFLTKGNVLDSFNTYEYYLIKTIDKCDLEYLQSIIDKIKNNLQIYDVDENHMRTTVNVVFIVDENVEKEVENFIKKFKFYKSYKFGLRGWVDISLILINADDNKILTNKKGKEVVGYLLAN